MNKSEAKRRIKWIAEKQRGQVSKSGLFVDLPNDPCVVGYGAVLAPDGKSWVIVSIPRE